MIRKFVVLASLAGALGLSACGDDGTGNGDVLECNGGGTPNSLEGSYCEDVSMSFSQVRVKKQSAGSNYYLIIDWVTPTAGGTFEKTLVVQFSAETVAVEAGVDIDFLAHGGAVRRVLAEGSQTLTEQLEPGMTKIRFDSFSPEIGAPVSGQVSMLFKSGRTLKGIFGGTLIDGNAPEM